MDVIGRIQRPPGTPEGSNALGKFISVGIQTFFVVAGIAALIYLLWGAFDWIVSGGDKERLEKARNKIVNALIGLFLMVFVLVILFTIERQVFNSKICFGIFPGCAITLPSIN